MSYPSNLLSSLFNAPTKRRCFISYHHADEDAVESFIYQFSGAGEVFTHRALGMEMESDIIDSTNTDYVMRAIRERYMANTSVTIVMLGLNTWKRRYVDWEIAASLRASPGGPPNGLLAIHLPHSTRENTTYPERLNANLRPKGAPVDQPCYARWMSYPTNQTDLANEIEAAASRRRTHAHLIENSAARFKYNKP